MDDRGLLLQQFGARVRDARNGVGLSQEQLADKAGLHRTYVGSLERGERNVSLVNIVVLATVLDVDAGMLLAGMSLAPEPDERR